MRGGAVYGASDRYAAEPADRYYQRVYNEYIAGKQAAGEDVSNIAADRFIERLFEQGIGCSVHYIPLHQQPYWRDRYGLKAGDFPHSQFAYEQMLSLPIYTRMTVADVERVIDAVRRTLAG